ncbi:MAG TPA: acyltransferase, partial [Rhodocyclaceae bacterium]|jgi:peptidoglycan/LPS O-acetylase OafA/YrhL|nr:acyltransferase [Rhodocyclaceae bacterium]
MNSKPSTLAHFDSIQLLRFVAALMVVLAHTTEAMGQRIIAFKGLEFWSTGAAGVDIFFVISGFVMTISSRAPTSDARTNRANAWDFIKRRFIRVVPLYWFYTVLKIISVLALPALALRTRLEPDHILASFLFIPYTSPWGIVQPVLPVGWTLNFEMLFYALFAIAIAFNFQRLFFCCIGFCLLYIAAHFAPDVAALNFYGRSILFEFGIGMLIARFHAYRLPLPLAALLVALGIALISGFTSAEDLDRIFKQGLGAGLLVLGAINLEQAPWLKSQLQRVSILGDISYSSYLCHSFLVPISVAVFGHIGLLNASLIIVLTALIVFVGSLASFLWLEKPMTEFLKQRFFKKKPRDHLAHTVTPAPENFRA